MEVDGNPIGADQLSLACLQGAQRLLILLPDALEEASNAAQEAGILEERVCWQPNRLPLLLALCNLHKLHVVGHKLTVQLAVELVSTQHVLTTCRSPHTSRSIVELDVLGGSVLVVEQKGGHATSTCQSWLAASGWVLGGGVWEEPLVELNGLQPGLHQHIRQWRPIQWAKLLADEGLKLLDCELHLGHAELERLFESFELRSHVGLQHREEHCIVDVAANHCIVLELQAFLQLVHLLPLTKLGDNGHVGQSRVFSSLNKFESFYFRR